MFPSQRVQFRGIGKLFHRAIGFFCVEIEVATEADDLFDQFCQIFYRNIFATSYVDVGVADLSV
jgi:hypothetical protein